MVILQGEMDAAASMIEKQSRQNPRKQKLLTT